MSVEIYDIYVYILVDIFVRESDGSHCSTTIDQLSVGKKRYSNIMTD